METTRAGLHDVLSTTRRTFSMPSFHVVAPDGADNQGERQRSRPPGRHERIIPGDPGAFGHIVGKDSQTMRLLRQQTSGPENPPTP